MSATELTDAESELRKRQGAGARYDAAAAPHAELAFARRGTAYFARKLSELSDDDLDAPSLLPGWSRRHVIAHVGYNARALTHLTEWARTGIETPMYASADARDRQLARGETLPARALRNLFDHAAVHLNVEWRDLTDEQWDVEVKTAQGRTVPVRETAWMRSREVWVHAVDLANDGSFLDFPPELVDRLIADVLGTWQRRGESVDLALTPNDRPRLADHGRIVLGTGGPVVSGAAADLARWLTGRGARRLSASSGELPDIPRWF
ncbi:mycothiol-dependent maleylpyruvate isomerase NagL [Gryllotalpicola daejeonensis]|uniref:Mycothiol-dependent maleylpyruvate isomerase NagL n=1 Tax=Gryllotalpicola daejeonensis TaxID=993087 RepID=A0ABP7ZN08_9MICO